MNRALDEAADAIRDHIDKGSKILYVSHNDADGITSGAVGLSMLAREYDIDPSTLEAKE